MSSRSRTLLFPSALYLAFFASGAGCLMAEVTWNRMLIVVVGNSVNAAAMIIVVFMGGLGLGSQVGGRLFGRRKCSLRPYLLLELGIGVYVLLSPWLFDLLSALFTALAVRVDDRSLLTLARTGITLLALFLPASLMGATFPALLAGSAADTTAYPTARAGYLYSINTLGAALGCLVAGYDFLFGFGTQATLGLAFGLYVLAASCALAADRVGSTATTAAVANAVAHKDRQSRRRARKVEAAPEAAAACAPVAAIVPSAVPPGFLMGATFGIGFVALAYEVLLTRLGILYFGNTVSIFPLVLTAFLLGTGISAVAATWLWDRLRLDLGGSDRLFGLVALAAGALVLLTPYLLLTDWVIADDPNARLADASSRNPLPILAIIVAPTMLIGALLPLAIRMLAARDRAATTRTAATLYALNSAGGLLGSALINHFIVPTLGTQGAFVGLALICAAIGLFAVTAAARVGAGGFAAALGTTALAVLLTLALPSIKDLYARKIAASTQARSATVKLVLEGRATTVTVVEQDDPKRGAFRDLYLNGVEEASTRYWHTQLFKLLGILPILVHEPDEQKQVLVIAFGAGITAGSTLASDQVASLDTVDLNRDIEAINDLFTDVNGDVFHQPRFHFHADDGRNFLVTSGKRYDVIISDSTHPRAYDSWVLYTEEFYRSVQRRLLPGGVFAQWVPVDASMRGDLFTMHLNTFRRVFPHATLWHVYGSDQAFLLATPGPFTLDMGRLQARLDRLPAWFRAQQYQIDTAARIAGFFWLGPRTMETMIGDEQRTNTDRLHHFDRQASLRPREPRSQLPAFHTRAAPFVVRADEALHAQVRDEQIVAQLLADYAFFGRKSDLVGAYCFMPGNGNARYWMARETAEQLPDPEAFCAPPR